MPALIKRNSWKLVVFYGIVFLTFTATFILSFHLPLFPEQTVLFYRGLELLILTIIVTSTTFVLLNQYAFKLRPETLIATLMISFSLHLSFFVLFPVTFDRSVTMFLLSALKNKPASQNCTGLPEKVLEQYFIDEYTKNNKAVGRRIEEQSIINIVRKQNNCIQLTPRGHNLLKLSEVIKKIYAVK